MKTTAFDPKKVQAGLRGFNRRGWRVFVSDVLYQFHSAPVKAR
jgi:hypothetical protein